MLLHLWANEKFVAEFGMEPAKKARENTNHTVGIPTETFS
jgi:hypothetical protein